MRLAKALQGELVEGIELQGSPKIGDATFRTGATVIRGIPAPSNGIADYA
jgi:hypothetical protein